MSSATQHIMSRKFAELGMECLNTRQRAAHPAIRSMQLQIRAYLNITNMYSTQKNKVNQFLILNQIKFLCG